MFRCPSCSRKQVRTRIHNGVFWVCKGCGGRIATIGLLRRLIDRDVIERYWKRARHRKSTEDRRRPCPACTQDMCEVSLCVTGDLPALDVCRACRLFWFDPREFEVMPLNPNAATHLERNERRRAIERRQAGLRPRPVEKLNWQILFLFFGLPMETEETQVQRRPWLTWSIASAIVIASLSAFVNLEVAVSRFALIPERAWRLGGATLITSIFLHGDLFHLVGNIYFLVVFGDNVEDFLGRWAYGLLFLLSGLSAASLHIALDPQSALPCIGASGAVSGVLTFYALRFPRAKIVVLYSIFPIRLNIWAMFAIWVAFQAVGLVLQANELTNVSAASHVGGASMGALFLVMESVIDRLRHPDIG